MLSFVTSTRATVKAAIAAGAVALTLAGSALSAEPAEAGFHPHNAFHHAHAGGFRAGGFHHFGGHVYGGFGHRFGGHRFGYGFGRPYGHFGFHRFHRPFYGYGFRRVGFYRPVFVGRPCLHRVFTPYGVHFRRFC